MAKPREFEPGKWELNERTGAPVKVPTFAFDTETLTLLDGKVLPEGELAEAVAGMEQEEKRRRLAVRVWAWQIYDEENGFFMANDFDRLLQEIGLRGYSFGWCYNSSFDFAQIDYQILTNQKWHPKTREKGRAYDRGEPWSYESINSDMGARYAYKLWAPYKAENRHTRVHATEFRDLMKLLPGGLAKVLEDLQIEDNDGNPIRKLKMDYQNAGRWDRLTESEIAYCRNDVAGLYFAVKKFDGVIAARSGGECRIFGENTNLMTAGGFAKRQLLRAMYPGDADYKSRLKAYQREHPITPELDKWIRAKHLYRGGISFVNPAYKGVELRDPSRPLYRYDVNSEYPYSMTQIRDLVGAPHRVSLDKWIKMPKEARGDYEAAYMLTRVSGSVRPGMLPIWWDPFRRDYVADVAEEGEHLIFERELDEMEQWYELEYEISYVVLWRRGGYAYRSFIEQNYRNKSEATNKTEKQGAKLELNSSYGKLAERLERVSCHYEMNSSTGAVHLVRDGEEVDGKSRMSVAVGALVTSFARCYILSKIREICPDPARDFVYIDTDSIHCFCPYDKADGKALGALKCEAVCPACKYIAPKTYLDILAVDETGNVPLVRGFEIHSKGVNLKSIIQEIAREGGNREAVPLEYLFGKMAYGKTYPVLMAMNVPGGKAIVPTIKYLARPETAPEKQYLSNYDKAFIMEP